MAQTTQEILDEVKEKGVITEHQIKLLKKLKNAGYEIDESLFWDNRILVGPDQLVKGYQWLMDKWKTPKGNERENNPFGYREQNVLESIRFITFDEFYQTTPYGVPEHFEPVYTVHGAKGSFQYYVNHGKINIIN
jgi:hypothetical protein